MQTALCSTQPPWLAMAAATMPREKKLRSRRWPVGRDAATHLVQRRPNHPPPIRNVRHDPGAQMRWSRAGARRCTRPSPVRSDRMWSLPIGPAAAIIYESIHSGALNGTVGSCLHSCGGAEYAGIQRCRVHACAAMWRPWRPAPAARFRGARSMQRDLLPACTGTAPALACAYMRRSSCRAEFGMRVCMSR